MKLLRSLRVNTFLKPRRSFCCCSMTVVINHLGAFWMEFTHSCGTMCLRLKVWQIWLCWCLPEELSAFLPPPAADRSLTCLRHTRHSVPLLKWGYVEEECTKNILPVVDCSFCRKRGEFLLDCWMSRSTTNVDCCHLKTTLRSKIMQRLYLFKVACHWSH